MSMNAADAGSLRSQQHTPGPWRASVSYPSGFDIRGPNDEDLGFLNASDGFDEPTAYPVAANAALVTAAPDLLKALRALFDSYKQLADSGDAGNWSIEDTPEGKQALAALAKAGQR